jgi:hypothetical protein
VAPSIEPASRLSLLVIPPDDRAPTSGGEETWWDAALHLKLRIVDLAPSALKRMQVLDLL